MVSPETMTANNYDKIEVNLTTTELGNDDSK